MDFRLRYLKMAKGPDFWTISRMRAAGPTETAPFCNCSLILTSSTGHETKEFARPLPAPAKNSFASDKSFWPGVARALFSDSLKG